MTDELQEDAAAGALIRVFLNYRREDTGGHALHLYSDLIERFGNDSIFMDMRALEPGLDFEDAIEAALGNCDVVLCLIGTHWVSAVSDEGVKRLDDPDDWVRLELEAALARTGVRVIPVLVERAEMPRRHEIPESVVPLSRRQAFDLSNVHWTEGVAKLVGVLERIAQLKAEGLAHEEREQERSAREDAERLAGEETERERLAREQAALTQLTHEQEEQERLAREVAREEAERTRLAREQAEQALVQEQADRDRVAREETERAAHEYAETQRLARIEAERTEGEGLRPPIPPPGRVGGLSRDRPGRRKLVLLAIALVLVVGAVLAAVVLLTSGGEDAFPTETESRLLGSVPAGVAESCDRSELSGAVAAVFCTPTDPDVGVSYYLFEDLEAMNLWYTDQLSFRGIERDSGDCFAPKFVGEGSYTISDESAGRVGCTLDDEGDAVRAWTDTRLNIGTTAFRLDANAAALFDAWKDDLGPNS